MNEFAKQMIKESSVPLPDGGDTHFHPWRNGCGFTVSTRLPGAIAIHDDFRFRNVLSDGIARPEVLRAMPW